MDRAGKGSGSVSHRLMGGGRTMGREESESGMRTNKQEEQQKEPSRSSSILESTHL